MMATDQTTPIDGSNDSLEARLQLLTRREAQVLEFIIQGLTNDQIALTLFRSPKTIDKHCQSIYRKIGVNKRVNLVREVLSSRSLTSNRDFNDSNLTKEAVSDIVKKSRAWDKMASFDSTLSRSSGPDYFGDITKALAETFGVKMAGVSEINIDEGQGEIIAFCVDGELQVPFTYPLKGSLCGTTFEEGKFEHLKDLKERFGDEACQIPQMGFDSYVGVRLNDSLMGPIGVLWISNDKPIDEAEMAVEILSLFAPKVAAELATQKALDNLA